MNPNNLKLKEIMKFNPEEISDDDMVLFVNEFMSSNLIMLCELDYEIEVINEENQYLSFDDFSEFNIIRLEDDEGNEFIPLFTDDDEIFDLEVPGYGIVISISDLANLLFDNPENNENLEGLILNPFTDYAASIPYSSLLGMFNLIECDDPDCNHEDHN